MIRHGHLHMGISRKCQSSMSLYSYQLYMLERYIYCLPFFCWYKTHNCLKVVRYLVYPSREFGTCMAMPTTLPWWGECENDYRKNTLSFDFCLQFLFLFSSALAGTLQLPCSSDISSSVIYVIPSPLQKSKILLFQKVHGHFPNRYSPWIRC